ncbi:translocation/assembly module TamB domain-containing protein [Caulobacter sp.]|uniref:translocation/assembly module TamB domain-containing protein n=1 Tax=Caulobacter sp. TaxID=78 RepID=UPI002B497A4C|nr:translocation/assembly module TamB domain-containing protein [Caulobacter sp.]HJV40757.1 translocation/assembly module TamB domain-containing protein [Caulobacter sp.]
MTETVVQVAEAAGETAVKAAKKIGWGGALLIASAILAAILIVMAGGLRFAPITPQGRMFLEARASGLKLGRIGKLHVEGLSGDIWKDFGVRRLTISDEKGVWLEAHDVRVAWRATELFGRRFHAERIDARDVVVLRRPTMGPKGKSSAAPVSVDLDAFAFRLITRPAFSGKDGDFDVAGEYEMARRGGQKGKAAVASRLHVGDHLNLDFDLGRSKTLHLVADATEAGGGAIAGALGLPADRPFDLKAKADGTTSRAAFTVRARSGADTPLDASGAWTPEGGSARGRLDLGASRLTQRLERMFGPRADFVIDGKKATKDGLSALTLDVQAENLSLQAHGLADLAKRRTGPDGLAFTARIGALKRIVSIPQMGQGLADGVFRLETGGFSVEGNADVADLELLGYHLKRAKGPALVRWAKGELEIKAQATSSGGGGTGLLAVLGASPKATFEGARIKGGRFLIRSARIDAPNLIVTGQGERGVLGGLSFDGEMKVASLGPVRQGARGSVAAKWSASSFAGRPWAFTVDGRAANFATGYAEIDRLLGATPRLNGKASWNEGVLTVADARLEGAAASVKTEGKLGKGLSLDFGLDWTATGPFRAGPVEIAGKASGEGKVGGVLSAPRADLTADFDSIDLPRLPLTKAHLALTFARGANATDGVAALQGQSAYGVARGRTAFRFSPGGIELSALDVDAGGAKAQGAVSLRNGLPATADLTLAIGPGAFLPQGQVKGTARLVDAPGGGATTATFDLTAQDVASGGWKVRSARIKADGPLSRLPLSIDARGDAPGGRWRLGGSGELAQTGRVYDLTLNASGRMGRTEIKTNEAARIRFGDGPTQARLRLAIDKGRADLDADLGGATAMLKAELTGVTLTAFDPDLDGDIDGSFNLRGQGETLGGDFTMRLSNARERGAKIEQSLDAKIHGDLTDSQLTIVADGDNRQGLKAEANLVLPVEASARPLRLMINKKRGVQGQFSAKGELKPLWDLLMGPERSLSGRINLQASLGGTLADPRLLGQATLDDGGFEDGQSGLRLRKVTLRSALADNAIDVSQAIGEDGQGGSVSGAGRISLARDGVGSFKLDLKSFRLIDNDLASAVATGSATVNRSADGKIKLAGAVTIDRADVSAQSKTPAGVVAMDVIERNRPQDLDQGLQRRPTTGGMILDLDLKAPRRVFVRGRGLDVELSLDAHVGGTSLAPALSGVARVVRGEYDFAGKRFEFDDDGTVYLASQLDRIRLDLSATREDTSLTAVVRIKGTAAKPEITLTSKPELPSDEVLSQVLFGSSAAQLSPIEAAQLASALASLAGGGGFDVIGNLRSFARLDRLAFAESATGMTVSGGKYVTDDVYLEIIGGGREGPAAQVEWRVRRTLSLVSRIGGQNDAKLSVRWRKDY